MFNHTAGIISDSGCDIKNSESLVGTTLRPLDNRNFDFPEVGLPDGTRIGTTTRENGGRNVVNTLPYQKAETLRNIAKEAGCHTYTEDFATVYGDNRFVAIFPTEEGNTVIHLKEVGTYRNLLTNEVFENTDEIEFELKKNEFIFLVKE